MWVLAIVIMVSGQPSIKMNMLMPSQTSCERLGDKAIRDVPKISEGKASVWYSCKPAPRET